jgi:hypothetical protein
MGIPEYFLMLLIYAIGGLTAALLVFAAVAWITLFFLRKRKQQNTSNNLKDWQ